MTHAAMQQENHVIYDDREKDTSSSRPPHILLKNWAAMKTEMTLGDSFSSASSGPHVHT
jgi:hypothetical protein